MKASLGFDAGLPGAAEPERETRGLREQAERWAATLTGALTPEPLPAPFQPDIAETAAPPVSWREGVEGLTQAAPPGAESVPSGDGSRLLVTLDGGDLGELACALERTDSGLRVVIGVTGRQAAAAFGAERGALEAALRHVGLPLQSVEIVPRSEVGTVLAQGKEDKEGKEAPAGRQARLGARVSREPRARSARRLKWIG